jgi:hypothetical protein
MSFKRALKRPAILCALLLALCTLATYPFVEMGQCDDFAYVRSAKTLAETGHITYYGWASAMLGWQLALGALFIKLFGFSFTAPYVSVLLVGLATAFFLQRAFVLLGLNEINAAFATLTLVLSPLFIALSFSFMSDIPGFFAIVLCLYLCLRAIHAPLPSQASAWLIAAAISNAILGTARQTGWLGLIVIVPSACWLLRHRRLPFALLGSIWLLCLGFVFIALHWFGRQMYATVETVNGVQFDRDNAFNATVLSFCVILEVAFFLFPILIAFIFPFARQNKRLTYLWLAGAIAFFACFLLRPHSYWVGVFLAPALTNAGNYVTSRGIVDLPDIGLRPVLIQPWARATLSVVCYFAAFAFLVVLLRRNRRPPVPAFPVPTFKEQRSLLSWRQIFILLGPFALAYCTFLFFRVLTGSVFDRYLLPLFMFLAVVAVRFYQDRINPKLPRTCYAVLLVFAVWAVAATHDTFAEDRARLAAIEQFRAAGLPRTAFYGGFPYDGWTQIDAQGYVDVGNIRTPTGIHQLSEARTKFKPCGYFHARFFPAIRPQYVLSYDNYSCGDPQDRFAPVPYRLWLPPFSGAIYSRTVSPAGLSQPDK